MKIKPNLKFAIIKKWFLKTTKLQKILILISFIGLGLIVRQLINKAKNPQITYETTIAQKGTLINSISASGSITSGNNTSVTTKVSGMVNKVYVTNGNTVTKGQKIAEVTLDDYAKERQTVAWVTYLEATEAVKEAVNAKAVADISMWQDRQAVINAQEAIDHINDGSPNDSERMIITKTLDQSRKAFTVSESKYLNANADIANANAKVAAALRNYHENSSVIYAPSPGTISDLGLAPGIVINANSSTSSSTGATIVSSQTVGKISSISGQLIASVSLPEVDIITVKANQKVTLTLDAYPDKSFTGKVLAVNTTGSVNSGVTSYPVSILLDPISVEVYPNMSVNVDIITNIKNDVVYIPTTAITVANNQSMVQVKKENTINTIMVELGITNDTQTEIISGINEGDEVVTSVINSSTKNDNATISPFSSVGRAGTGRNSMGDMPRGDIHPPSGF